MHTMKKVADVTSTSDNKIDSTMHIAIADILMVPGPNKCGGDHIMEELKIMALAVFCSRYD